mmetsp:Transcript_85899/g.240169  ORF Transcript_85899/g.240169 Transcript_85899/m.240169 type:complete len:211 (+) Transcript_85899:56-688(+)
MPRRGAYSRCRRGAPARRSALGGLWRVGHQLRLQAAVSRYPPRQEPRHRGRAKRLQAPHRRGRGVEAGPGGGAAGPADVLHAVVHEVHAGDAGSPAGSPVRRSHAAAFCSLGAVWGGRDPGEFAGPARGHPPHDAGLQRVPGARASDRVVREAPAPGPVRHTRDAHSLRLCGQALPLTVPLPPKPRHARGGAPAERVRALGVAGGHAAFS